jgi:hypothetical protein
VPVVSEDPKPYYPYPAIYCTSEDSSWSDISTTTSYQERNIFETHCPEGAYIEKVGSKVFIITHLPGLKVPSEPTKLLGTTPGDTLTTQTTRLLSTSPTTTGSSLKLNREHLRKKLPRSFKPTPSQRKKT